MERRDFLSSMLALCVAPAVVRAENIMRVRPVLVNPCIAIANELDQAAILMRGEIVRLEGFNFFTTSVIEYPPSYSEHNRERFLSVMLNANKEETNVFLVHPEGEFYKALRGIA
jgi:hypothetical protein